MKKLISFGTFVFWIFSSASAQATTLDANGATGVVVGSNTYIVSFVSGSCASALGGCDSSSDFIFNSLSEATQASIALFDLITASSLINSPSAFAGCTSTTNCYIDTPYDLGSTGYLASYVRIRDGDSPTTGDNSLKTGFDITFVGPELSFGVWTVAETPPAIPLPAGLPLLMTGLLGLGLWKKRAERA